MHDYAVFICDESLEQRDRTSLLTAAAILYTGRPDGDFTVEKTEKGKPFFPAMPDLHFSVSHSGNYWACAFGNAPVGLDLQKTDEVNVRQLSRRFFHMEESAYVRKEGFSPAAFYRIWCARESYAKFTGEGLSTDGSTFSTLHLPQGVSLRRLHLLPGYACCLCAKDLGDVTLHPFME